MGTTYSVNQFDEVVPCYDGRTILLRENISRVVYWKEEVVG